jgi:hypothetical protein
MTPGITCARGGPPLSSRREQEGRPHAIKQLRREDEKQLLCATTRVLDAIRKTTGALHSRSLDVHPLVHSPPAIGRAAVTSDLGATQSELVVVLQLLPHLRSRGSDAGGGRASRAGGRVRGNVRVSRRVWASA